MTSIFDSLYINSIADILEKLCAINDSRLINKVMTHFHFNESQISDFSSGTEII